jgi:predicted acylesterase/phospholipase RssA
VKALILSGGGARGAYEAGVVCGLADGGQRFDLICGTSIGAINAAFAAQDMLHELEQLWKSIASSSIIALVPEAQHVKDFVVGFEDFLKLPLDAKIFRLPHICELYTRIGSTGALLSLLGVLDRTPVTQVLKGKLNIDNLKHSLVVATTNITQETVDSFYTFVATEDAPDAMATQSAFLNRTRGSSYQLSNLNFLGAIEASSAIPLAFAPVEFNHGTNRNFLYVDGGVANNTPISLSIAAGAKDVTVVFIDPEVTAPPYQDIANAATLGMACYSVMQQKILADDMKLALMINTALAASEATDQKDRLKLNDKSEITLREVRPKRPLDLSILEFNDQQKLTEAFELGLADGREPKTIWPPA